MLSIKKILFPTDFSENADAALSLALLLAKNFEAELDMLHAVVLHGDDVGEDVYSRFPDIDRCITMLMENADSKLEKTIEDSGKLTVRQAVRRGFSAVDEILGFSREENVDLIVMGTHGRRGLRHMLLGSVAEEVVRSADCPVLTVRRTKDFTGKIDIRRILLPTDFSGHSALAARYANVLAKILGAKLDVLHVIDSTVHPAYHAAGISSPTKLDAKLTERLKSTALEFLQAAGVTAEHTIHIGEGKPEMEIARMADEAKDTLIIIACHGAGALERMLLGSTTERVIRLAASPVLTVKKDERDFVR